jgi:hypothetical protein
MWQAPRISWFCEVETGGDLSWPLASRPRGPVLQVLADRAGLSGLRAGLCVELRGGL